MRAYQNFPGPNTGWVAATAAAAARSSPALGARKAFAGELFVCVEGPAPVVPHPDSAATTQAIETMETLDPLDIQFTFLPDDLPSRGTVALSRMAVDQTRVVAETVAKS